MWDDFVPAPRPTENRRSHRGPGGKRLQPINRTTRALRRVPLVLPHEPLSVRDLSRKLGMKMKDVIPRLIALGEPASISPETLVELDTAELLGLEMRRVVERMSPAENLEEFRRR